MDREKFIKTMRSILDEDAHQNKRGRFIKSSLKKEIRAIRSLAKESGIKLCNEDFAQIIPELHAGTLEWMK